MPCTKAIIPVAGYGTRRLPITKAVEKCMLPVLNRPVIDYVVEDCIRAGVTDIYFVVNRNGDAQLRRYYGRFTELEEYLSAKGKLAELELIKVREGVRFHYVYQPDDGRYGTTIPVWLCREYIDRQEQVLVLMGDDFIFNADGSSEARRLIEAGSTKDAVMLGVPVERSQVSRYGVIAMKPDGSFDHIQEKPKVKDAASNLINVSKYLFSGDFVDCLDEAVRSGLPGGAEYYITDPINAYVAQGRTMAVIEARGRYLDCGTVQGWLEANNHLANSASV